MSPRKPKTKIICGCLGVTEAEIVAAVDEHDLCSVKQVGACTGAGTGCTACHPVIHDYLVRQARTRDTERASTYAASAPIFSAR